MTDTPATCRTDAELRASVDLWIYGTTDPTEVARLAAEDSAAMAADPYGR
jgi:hypothetical protein